MRSAISSIRCCVASPCATLKLFVIAVSSAVLLVVKSKLFESSSKRSVDSSFVNFDIANSVNLIFDASSLINSSRASAWSFFCLLVPLKLPSLS